MKLRIKQTKYGFIVQRKFKEVKGNLWWKKTVKVWETVNSYGTRIFPDFLTYSERPVDPLSYPHTPFRTKDKAIAFAEQIGNDNKCKKFTIVDNSIEKSIGCSYSRIEIEDQPIIKRDKDYIKPQPPKPSKGRKLTVQG